MFSYLVAKHIAFFEDFKEYSKKSNLKGII